MSIITIRDNLTNSIQEMNVAVEAHDNARREMQRATSALGVNLRKLIIPRFGTGDDWVTAKQASYAERTDPYVCEVSTNMACQDACDAIMEYAQSLGWVFVSERVSAPPYTKLRFIRFR